MDMTNLETYFTVEKGKATYLKLNEFKQAISSLKDGYYKNTIEMIYNNRSNAQNRYYWGCLLPELLKGFYDVGFEISTVEKAHEWCKNKFLKVGKRKRKRVINKQTGEIMYLMNYPSSKELNTIEFNEYFEKIIVFAAEYLSVQIPLPNEIINQ